MPTLRTDDGTVLTENAAILQYVAVRFPNAGIWPVTAPNAADCINGSASSAPSCTRACSYRCLSKDAPAEVKSYTLTKYLSRLDYLDKYLKGREFLLDHFSVADAYLATVLNWSIATPMIDFAKYPAVKDYLERMKKRRGDREGARRGVRTQQGRNRTPQGGGVAS